MEHERAELSLVDGVFRTRDVMRDVLGTGSKGRGLNVAGQPVRLSERLLVIVPPGATWLRVARAGGPAAVVR
jgi:hypothetical protein